MSMLVYLRGGNLLRNFMILYDIFVESLSVYSAGQIAQLLHDLL